MPETTPRATPHTDPRRPEAAADAEPDAGAGAPNVAHLRHAIDRGGAADKTPFDDPAAAPLGTDDEAGGAPNSSAQVARSLALEVEGRAPERDANASARIPTNVSVGPAPGRRPTARELAPWLAVAGLIVVTLAVIFAMSGLGLMPA